MMWPGNITFRDANEAFEYFYKEILKSGVNTNIGTKAFYNVGFVILHPLDNEITAEWRKWSKKYAEREWNWYLSGEPTVEEIKKYAPIWDKMHNGDNRVNSNYGYQWMRNGQLAKCIEQLRNNPNSRQAWISIYDGKEKELYDYDTPCTLSIGFSINPTASSYLNMTVIMRSNDLIYGFCNDQYCFSELQQKVADELGLNVGMYFHFAHDLHIYKRHFNMKEDFYNLKK